jgi:hypothetical protein
MTIEDRNFLEGLNHHFIIFEYGPRRDVGVTSFPCGYVSQLRNKGIISFRESTTTTSEFRKNIEAALKVKLLNEGFLKEEDVIHNWMEIPFSMFQGATEREKTPESR